MSQNDIRRLENMPSIGPQGDQYFVPANMTTSERALSGDMGNGGNIGSDTSGFPGEGGGAPEAWMRGLPKMARQEATKQLADLRAELPERKMEWMEAARMTLAAALKRMLKRESVAIAAAAKNNDFPVWLRGYYAKHYEAVVEDLTPACGVLRIAGVVKWEKPEELAAFLKARSTEVAESAWNGDTPTAFGRRMDDWPKARVKELVEEIMR
jgi:hypothetical protein